MIPGNNLVSKYLVQPLLINQVIILNIPELKTTEEELKKILHKEKGPGELKSRFVSMAFHEFRTPLSTILSSVNILTHILNDFLLPNKFEAERIIKPCYEKNIIHRG